MVGQFSPFLLSALIPWTGCGNGCGHPPSSAWSKTIKARSAGGMANARNVLIEELVYLYYAKGWKIIVAFDEHTPGNQPDGAD